MNVFEQKPVLADTGAVMQLRGLDEEVLKGLTITLLGKDSKVYRDILRERQQVMLNRLSKGRKGADLNAAKMAEDSLDDLVRLTLSWEGIEDEKGALKFNPENVRRLYEDVPSIREQVEQFIAERVNFLAKPSSD
jgi:hypothetical protein